MTNNRAGCENGARRQEHFGVTLLAPSPSLSAVLHPLTADPGGLGVTVHDRLVAAEGAWRAVEARGVLTPYQRYDWIRAIVAAGLEDADRLAVAVIETAGRPAGILPLAIRRRLGFTEARLVGTDHGNGDWLAGDPAFLARLTADRLSALLSEIAAAAGGVDVIRFFNQQARRQGIANPVLALSSLPAPNNFYAATVAPTLRSYADEHLPARRRGNIRRGARRLEETFGPLEVRRADTAEELARQQAVFLEQRGERFAEMGVENVFGEPGFVRFFSSLATAGFGEARPALAFHALYAGETIVATSIGAFEGSHYSQYINSTASGAAGKSSLMSILLTDLIDRLVADGVTTIDMGIGDFDYKTVWTTPEALFHSVIPITSRGRRIEPALGAARAMKRLVKQTPPLWGFAQTARRAAYRLRHGS